MAYFDDAVVGDEVYGMIFGPGVIAEVLPDSFYSIIVCFDNSYQVPYTDEGVPSWGSFDEQTAYYKKDIDLTKRDFSPVQKVLDPESIIRLRNEKMLQMRLPSGIWCDVENADIEYVQESLEQKLYHMFRAKKSQA